MLWQPFRMNREKVCPAPMVGFSWSLPHHPRRAEDCETLRPLNPAIASKAIPQARVDDVGKKVLVPAEGLVLVVIVSVANGEAEIFRQPAGQGCVDAVFLSSSPEWQTHGGVVLVIVRQVVEIPQVQIRFIVQNQAG